MMIKKIIITEEQLKQILGESLGIAKQVTDISKSLKIRLFKELELAEEGSFDFLDFKVCFKKINFEKIEEFYNWYDTNYQQVINGYSFKKNTLYLTLIIINGDYNVSALNDTIQHELEHYYQCKMAGHDFASPEYNNAYYKMNDYNDYIKHVSRIEYFSRHTEIDAFINGAYFAAEELEVSTYESFIEQTELKYIKKSLLEAYAFFKSVKFEGLFFNEMVYFIKTNNYYNNCDDYKKLRQKICNKCKDVYEYFIRKSSRAYALIQIEIDERNKKKGDASISKIISKINDISTNANI